MRMIGINAVIACARLGRRGLALREIAGQLQELARDASARLPEIKTELVEMIELSSETIALLEAASDRANALPEGAVRQLSEGVREVGDSAVRSSEIVSDIRTKLNSSHGWLRPLEEHAQMIQKCARIFAPDLEHEGFLGAEDDIASKVFEVYTMERERDIHRKIIMVPKATSLDDAQFAKPAPAPAPEETSASDSLDDIFF
jgi:methyl-accepting chemotaxis protein